MIPFEIRTLKKPHTEKRRTRRIVYYKAICWHRGTVGAWRNRGYLRVLLMFLSTSLQSSGLQDYLKTFITKAISNTYTTALSLFVPSAPPLFCLLCFSPPCSPPLCVTFVCSRLTLSLQIPEELFFANSLKTKPHWLRKILTYKR